MAISISNQLEILGRYKHGLRIFVMKKRFLALAIMASTFSMHAMAADIEANMVKQVVEVTTPAFADFLATNPLDIAQITSDFVNQATKSSSVESSFSNSHVASSTANGVSSFEIVAVGSSNVGWESISATQLSTNLDHSGSDLYVTAIMLGMGYSDGATLNGLAKQAFKNQALCGADLHDCLPGDTLSGFMFYFDYSGQESGTFNTSAHSIAIPFGYWSDSIYIN